VLAKNEMHAVVTRLEEIGCRFTAQRQAVLAVLIQNQDRYLRSDEIFRLVKVKVPEVGQATVYRTLALFEQLQLLTTDCQDGKGTRFRWETGAPTQPVRLICRQCGRVHLEPEEACRFQQLLHRFQFRVEQVKLYGLCPQCQMEH
jgi:Fur family transcriptional regulator, ferric uptake regulator